MRFRTLTQRCRDLGSMLSRRDQKYTGWNARATPFTAMYYSVACSLALNILLHRSSILEVSRSFFFHQLDRSFPYRDRCSLLPCMRSIIFPSTSPLLLILPVLSICILASSKLEFHAPFSFCLIRQADNITSISMLVTAYPPIHYQSSNPP